jgi:hypothetical protein
MYMDLLEIQIDCCPFPPLKRASEAYRKWYLKVSPPCPYEFQDKTDVLMRASYNQSFE